MSSFPSTFRSVYTDTEHDSNNSSYEAPFFDNDSESESHQSRIQADYSGRYLDLDLEYDLDDVSTKKPGSPGSSSTATLLGSRLNNPTLTAAPKLKNYAEPLEMEAGPTGDDKPIRKKRYWTFGERVAQFCFLAFSFVVDFGLIFLDWFMDLVTGAIYLWNGQTAFGLLSLAFPLLAGIICSIRLPGLVKKHKDAYFCFDSRVLKILSKVPTLQPAIFSYHVFKTEVLYYPMNLKYFPHIADLHHVSAKLNILEGVFEATPQAVLQLYIYFVGIDILRTRRSQPYFAVAKILVSLVSMSRVCVKYWQVNSPFIFLPDPDPDIDVPEYTYAQTSAVNDYVKKAWQKFVSYCLLFPYYLEGFTLSCLRVTTIILCLLILSDKMEFGIVMSIPEPKLLIPFLSLILLLVLPRLLFSFLLWTKCLFSTHLERQWKEYQIPQEDQNEQKAKYLTKFLNRGIFSILVYPIHANQFLFGFYGNLEIVFVFLSYVHLYPNGHAIANSAAISNPVIFWVLLIYYFCVLFRILFEQYFLSRPMSPYLLPRRLILKCENIIRNLEPENRPGFSQIKYMLLDFTEFYRKSVLDKNFITTRGIKAYLKQDEAIVEIFSLPWNKTNKNALLNEYPLRISENGSCLVHNGLPMWKLIHSICCQVLLYYSMKHMAIFQKFELFQNLKRLHKFKTVTFDMTSEERDVLLSFVDILKPLSYIFLINYYTTPRYNFTQIQNYNNYEFPLRPSSVQDVDSKTIAYIVKAIVAARQTDWNLTNLHNFLDLYLGDLPNENQVTYEPFLEQDIPYVDTQL